MDDEAGKHVQAGSLRQIRGWRLLVAMIGIPQLTRHCDEVPVLPYPQSPSSEDQCLRPNEHAEQSVPIQYRRVHTPLHRQVV